MDTLYFLIKICSSLYAFKSHDVQEKQKKTQKQRNSKKSTKLARIKFIIPFKFVLI